MCVCVCVCVCVFLFYPLFNLMLCDSDYHLVVEMTELATEKPKEASNRVIKSNLLIMIATSCEMLIASES